MSVTGKKKLFGSAGERGGKGEGTKHISNGSTMNTKATGRRSATIRDTHRPSPVRGHSVKTMCGASFGSIESCNFDAYGTLLRSRTPKTNWQFGGDGLWDPNSKFTYQLARFGDGGHFISHDSFEADSTTPDSLHKYEYARANPIRGLDPSGQLELPELLVVMAIGAFMATLGIWWDTRQTARAVRAVTPANAPNLAALFPKPSDLQGQFNHTKQGRALVRQARQLTAGSAKDALNWIVDHGGFVAGISGQGITQQGLDSLPEGERPILQFFETNKEWQKQHPDAMKNKDLPLINTPSGIWLDNEEERQNIILQELRDEFKRQSGGKEIAE